MLNSLSPDLLRKLAHILIILVMCLVIKRVRKAITMIDKRREMLLRRAKYSTGTSLKRPPVRLVPCTNEGCHVRYDHNEDTYEVTAYPDQDHCDVTEEDLEESDVRQVEKVLE